MPFYTKSIRLRFVVCVDGWREQGGYRGEDGGREVQPHLHPPQDGGAGQWIYHHR